MATAAPASGGADSHILREYLVALGFRIDERRQRTMSNTLTGMDKRAQMLGRSLLGAGAAAVTMATVFTRSMERVFYNSRYANTTVSNLQAMEFAGRNIGLAGGEMTASIKGMATAIRSNPGLVGLLEKLGVPVKGRDMSDVMWDFVHATKALPKFIGQQYGEMFGISPETLFNLQEGEEQGRAAMQRRKEMAKELGVDVNQLAKDSVELSNIWRDLSEAGTMFGLSLMKDAMPAVKAISGTLQQMMMNWSDFTDEVSRNPWMQSIFKGVDRVSDELESSSLGSIGDRLKEGVGLAPTGGGVRLTDDTTRRLGVKPSYEHSQFEWFGIPRALEGWNKWRDMKDRQRKGLPNVPEAGAYDIREDDRDFKPRTGRKPSARDDNRDAGDTSPGGVDMPSSFLYDDAGDTSPGGIDQPGFDPQQHMHNLERRYHLPRGWLDLVYARESGRGAKMRSPAGAKGPFQFMPSTAKGYGITGQEDDFMASSDASARMWRDLLKQYGGDVTKAVAGYNWGSKNLAQYGLGAMPKETRDYADYMRKGIGADNVNVNTDIHINGVSDPAQAAELVRRKQLDVAGDVVRNMSPRVR